LANQTDFFVIGALQFQDFAIFQNFLRQKGSVSFDLVDKTKFFWGILFQPVVVFFVYTTDLLSIRNQRVIIGSKVSILRSSSLKPDKWPIFTSVAFKNKD
jgi:hypothetical protein